MRIRTITVAWMLGAAVTTFGQDGTMLKQKLAQMGAATKSNASQLSGYQWQESVSVAISGHQAPPRQSLCRYAADGTILKTPIGEPADDPAKHGGPLRRHMIEEKEEQVADLGKTVGQYLPPSPGLLLGTLARGNVALVPDQGGPAVVLSDYAKSGDKMKLILDPASMQAIRIDISTYLDKDRSPVIVQVQFARLADNTLYPAQSTISAPEKKILITTANTSYVRVAP